MHDDDARGHKRLLFKLSPAPEAMYNISIKKMQSR
jgi:hypothetical protein